MPRQTKAEIQANLAAIMETLFAASVALDEDLSDQEEDPTSDGLDVDEIDRNPRAAKWMQSASLSPNDQED